MEFTLFYRYPVDMIWSVGPTSKCRKEIEKIKLTFFGENYRKIGFLLRVLAFDSDTARSKQSFADEMNRRGGILKSFDAEKIHCDPFPRCDDGLSVRDKRKQTVNGLFKK